MMSDFRSFRGAATPVMLGTMLLAFFLVFTGCNKKQASAADATADSTGYKIGEPVSDSSTAAIVASTFGSDTLSTKEFFDRYNMIVQQYPTVQSNPEQSKQLRRTIVEDFIMQHLVAGEEEQLGLQADTARVNEQLRQIKGQFPNEEAFQQVLASRNMTEDSLRANIADFVKGQMLQERFETSAANPTPEEIEAFRNEQSEEIRAQHILFLVPPGTPEAKEDSIKSVAQAVLDSARSGQVPFDVLAKRHSQDGSAQNGGDLDYFHRGQMVAPFEKAAFALADSGDVTPELVRTQFGYHIIRLTGRRTSAPMDTTRARQTMLAQRRQEAVQNEVERLKSLATVRINPKVVDVDLKAEQENEQAFAD
ncbi:MAG TPA: peptidylprolyl isomerase [Rhodothermales bacterium]|nr:peptidylprolyl isomerase [Rhodothermales bacterium]